MGGRVPARVQAPDDWSVTFSVVLGGDCFTWNKERLCGRAVEPESSECVSWPPSRVRNGRSEAIRSTRIDKLEWLVKV